MQLYGNALEGKNICKKILVNQSLSDLIANKTGLKVNSFFSASKLKWVIENETHIKNQLENGDILFGTLDTYLIYRLTKCKEYVTDTTNASRTLLFNCNENTWDPELFSAFEIKKITFAEVKPSAGDLVLVILRIVFKIFP